MTKRNPNADRSAALFELGQIERAQDVLTLLDQHLYLTNDQVERLVFRTGTTTRGQPRRARGAPYAANTALRRLFDAGLIIRIPVYLPARSGPGVRPHYVNALTSTGARAVRPVVEANGHRVRWRRHLLPKVWQPIAHGFWIREVYSSLALAATRSGLALGDWEDDRTLAAQARHSADPLAVIPDGQFSLREATGARTGTYLLEIDLDTAVLTSTRPGRRDWTRKVTAYSAPSTRDLRQRYGGDVPVIILTATTSPTRMHHLLEATRRAGGQGRFWFTTLAELVPTPLSPAHLTGKTTDEVEQLIAEHEQRPLGALWRSPSGGPRRGLRDRHPMTSLAPQKSPSAGD